MNGENRKKDRLYMPEGILVSASQEEDNKDC